MNPNPDPSRRPTYPSFDDDRIDEAISAVHAAEQSRLCVEASRLALGRCDPGGGQESVTWLGVDSFGVDLTPLHSTQRWTPLRSTSKDSDFGRREPRSWNARAREEIALANADGVWVPRELLDAVELLKECDAGNGRAVTRLGPNPSRSLAQAAIARQDGPEGRLALARALVLEGRPKDALDQLDLARADATVDLVVDPAKFWSDVDLCRAAAFERLGMLVPAYASLVSAQRELDRGSFVAAVHLALAVTLGLDGDARRATRAWVDRADPTSANLERVLSARVPVWCRWLDGTDGPPELDAGRRDADRSPNGRVRRCARRRAARCLSEIGDSSLTRLASQWWGTGGE